MKKPNITPGKWSQGKYSKGNIMSEYGRLVANCMGYSTNADNGAHIKESFENSELIIKAGNLTNAGFNIEAIEEMYEVLKDTLVMLYNLGCNDESEAVQSIAKALDKAKFES